MVRGRDMGQSHTFFAVRERVFGPDGASAAACSPFEPAPGALRALGLGFFFGGDSIVSCSCSLPASAATGAGRERLPLTLAAGVDARVVEEPHKATAVSASEAGGESGCSVLARSSRSGNIGP
jgi:hypothetical protein